MLRVYTQTNLRPLDIQNFDVNDIVLYHGTRVRFYSFTQHVNENAYVFRPFSWRLVGF